ncbi:MAG: hypothetical protein N2167_09035 [Flavobacteriales bacterium]|nr:hypothetical protein [Flavobacteriales bacterium]
MTGCRNNKIENQNIQTVRITISGLDGQGVAEGRIQKALDKLPGIKKISFEYLFDCFYVSFDSTKITKDMIIHTIQSIEADKYKILEIESAISTQKPKLPSPTPLQQEEISDDVNIYKNDV